MLKRTSIGLLLILLIATFAAIGFNRSCPFTVVHTKVGKVRWGHIPILSSAIESYKNDTGRYPTKEEGLKVLVLSPLDASKKRTQYLNYIPADPWGNNYVYSQVRMHGVKFLLYSKGLDGIDNKGNHYDVVNWDKEYTCENYQNYCTTFCESALRVAIFSVFMSCLMLIGLLLFYVVTCVLRRKG